MPYFSHTMAKSVKPNMVVQTAPTRQVRSMPGNAPNGSSVVYKEAESWHRERYRYEVSQRKLLFMRSLISAQVHQLLTGPAPFGTDTAANLFATYKINT